MPDGTCLMAEEGCECPDCAGSPSCTTCSVDGMCAPKEPCECADCVNTPWCASCPPPDQFCYAPIEKCTCPDCVGDPDCP
jgi:hypothetical protein